MKTKTLSLLLISLVLVCFALSPAAHAVVPAPDGCYPGFTTAEGCNALQSLTTGAGNTGVGWRSLFVNTTGNFNTALGAGALIFNNGDSNTAVGAVALLLNTTGRTNTATGTDALVFNSTGNDNTAVGAFALENSTTSGNTAVGSSALMANTAGEFNTAVGASTLVSNTNGNDNTGIGLNALFSNTTGAFNTAVGRAVMGGNTTGNNNTAVGWFALTANTVDGNTAIGWQALTANTTGLFNTAVGAAALIGNTTGSNNTAIGNGALYFNTIGTNNTVLGLDAGMNVTTANNVICIGAAGNDVDNSCYIANIFGATSSGGVGVFVNTNGRLGTVTSSKRFKEDIKPMEKASEALFTLKPVSFRYKKEVDPEGPQGKSQFGLVAEDVEKVNPDLVVRDKEGKPYSVRYDQVNAMLLNEFLKEHKAFVKEQRKVEELEKQVAALTAGLQRVSAQLEVSKAASQTVLNNQ